MATIKEGLKFINNSSNRNNLKELGIHLSNVKNKRGFFPLVRLSNMGLIKKHVTNKGKMVQGKMMGVKSHYVLTQAGERALKGINRFGL